MKTTVAWTLASVLTLTAATTAHAERLPHHEPKALTERAECVVEVEFTGEDAARIVATYVESPHLRPGSATIDVPALAELDTRLDPFAGADEQSEPERERAVLFLDYDAEMQRWQPMHTFGQGSQGVWWIEGTRVLRYTQSMNPGPYFLRPWEGGDADRLRELVCAGVRGRSLITQATAEPRHRRALACWLEYLALPHPDARLVARQIARRHGAVQALTDALSAAEETTRLGVLRTLRYMGTAASRAARAIEHRARNSTGDERRAALSALEAVAPSELAAVATPVILEGTRRDALHVAGLLGNHAPDATVGALSTRLARPLPDELPHEHATDLRNLLFVLRGHAPDRAAAIARRWKDDPRFADHHRSWFEQISE